MTSRHDGFQSKMIAHPLIFFKKELILVALGQQVEYKTKINQNSITQ